MVVAGEYRICGPRRTGCRLSQAEAAEAAVALASGLVAAAVVTEAIGAGALVGWSGATNNPPATRRSS